MNRISLLILLAFGLLTFSCGKKSEPAKPSIREIIYNHQTSMHKIYKPKDTEVVMLGNSITFGANWNELLGRDKIVNRGISSDRTLGFLNRLENVISIAPKYCFIMGGINDIYNDIAVESICGNYTKIVNRLIDNNIKPVIQSTLYVSPKWNKHEEKNKEVVKLNLLLKKLAADKKIKFIDLNEVLSNGSTLNDKYTTDGVHLNAKGYKIWGEKLEKVFAELGI